MTSTRGCRPSAADPTLILAMDHLAHDGGDVGVAPFIAGRL
jgi:hypothetical protein